MSVEHNSEQASNFDSMKLLLREYSGQENMLAVPRALIRFLGGEVEGALFLNQLIYWSDKSKAERGFWKTYAEWENEIGLSEYKIRKWSKKFIKDGYLKTYVKKVTGNPTLHFIFDIDVFLFSLANFLKEPKQTNSTIDGEKNQVSYNTKNTKTKITPKINNHTENYEPVNGKLGQTLKDFYEMRTKIKHPMTDRAKELLLRDLEKLAPGSDEKKIEILEQSIYHSWQGVFPLKKPNQYSTGGNGFQRNANEIEDYCRERAQR